MLFGHPGAMPSLLKPDQDHVKNNCALDDHSKLKVSACFETLSTFPVIARLRVQRDHAKHGFNGCCLLFLHMTLYPHPPTFWRLLTNRSVIDRRFQE